MATMAETWTTRSRFRAELRTVLDELVNDATKDVKGGSWDGVPVVTRKDLDEAIEAAFGLPIPPPDERTAEVSTPAVVLVSAFCPRCSLPATIPVTIGPELRVDADGAEIRLKAKAKARSHTCGQLLLPVALDGQTDFGLDDIVTSNDALTDAERADEPATETEACPYPGCVLTAEHEGDHEHNPEPPADGPDQARP